MLSQWLTLLRDKFDKSRLAANVAIGAIMLALEKLLETEFNCPCSPMWNALYTSLFFIIPTFVSFTLMMLIQNCKCKSDDNESKDKCSEKDWGKTFISLCMALVWLVLVLYDGQYFACGCTDWEGNYIYSEHLKWCKPENATEERRVQLTQRVKYLYMYSQVRACSNGVGWGYVCICMHFLHSGQMILISSHFKKYLLYLT